MTSYKCKECGNEFEKEKSLHCHLKKHKITVSDYYIKHFPRFDLYSHAQIKFKNTQQYMGSDFNSPANFRKWCETENASAVKRYLVDQMRKKINEKGGSAVMGQSQLKSYGWPAVETIKDLFGSFTAFCQQVGHPAQFGSKIPVDFYKDQTDKEVWVDTREQNPWNLMNPVKDVKLDVGDYTMGGDDFDHTFIDRKSAADFIGTMVKGLDRFKKEIERCASIGGYMFIVVDSTMSGVSKELQFSRSRTNIQHVWHNMREIMNEFHGDCQFVFSGGRANSAVLAPKILACGKSLWKVDVQYFIEQNEEWLGK